MITDLYCPTRGVDFLLLTCVCDSPEPVSLTLVATCGGGGLQEIGSALEEDGLWFHHFEANNLSPSTSYTISAEPADQPPVVLQTSTLSKPPGKHLFRFGILADPHCCDLPTKYGRQFDESFALFGKYLGRLTALGAQCIFLPGDMTEQGTAPQLARCHQEISAVSIPVHVMAGNHEHDPDLFRSVFSLEPGYYSFEQSGQRFICLQTTTPRDLEPHTAQFAWLQEELAAATEDIYIFSHYSLTQHPYLERENGASISNCEQISQMLGRVPNVRAVFSGHKNVPTRTDCAGVAHLVCPQLVQTPCGFDLVDIYDGGLVRHLFEIDETNLDWRSRSAYPSVDEVHYRYGLEEGRNMSLFFTRDAPARRIMNAKC